LSPLQPFLQTQTPSTQKPWPEQEGSEQSAEKNKNCFIKNTNFEDSVVELQIENINYL